MTDPWVAIDFETADPKRDSACAVGLVRVECGEVVRREVRLIRPPRGVDARNYAIHRISFKQLQNQPPFGGVWPALLPVLAGAARLVAHGAAFDRSVLKACCTAAGLPVPELPWVCTCKLAQDRWPEDASHRLPDVCRRLKIDLRRHHDAGADAEACALCLVALEGMDSAEARERAKGLAAVFARAAELGRAVYGFDSRTPSCGRVTPTTVPPGYDRFTIEGQSGWTEVARGDLGREPEPEEPEPRPELFSKYGTPAQEASR